MKALATRGRWIDRSKVEKLAEIMGPQSAAQKCLGEEKRRASECAFFQVGDVLLCISLDEQRADNQGERYAQEA